MPVLLVPGLGLGAESWAPMREALHRAGTPDRELTTTALVPGYGRPGRRGVSLAPDVLAGQVLAQAPSGAAFLVVALSAGCQLAAHLARLAPDRVAGLVLIGPTTDPRASGWPRLVRRWVGTVRSESMRQVPVLLRQYRRTGLLTMARAMNRARHDRIDAVLSQVDCPVLVVRGPHDRISPEDWTESLTRRPGAGRAVAPIRHSVTLDAGAHMVPYTHADAVAVLVGDFLTRLAPGPTVGVGGEPASAPTR